MQSHARAPTKMSAGVVSMVINFGMWFWKVPIQASTNPQNFCPLKTYTYTVGSCVFNTGRAG